MEQRFQEQVPINKEQDGEYEKSFSHVAYILVTPQGVDLGQNHRLIII